MRYENSAYWKSLHREFEGGLRAVGHPHLGERLNELKYASEAETFIEVVARVLESFAPGSELRVLDLGTGVGFWARLLDSMMREAGFSVRMTVLDISAEALETVGKALPEAERMQADLKQIDLDARAGEFDLVFAGYCLHHLDRLDDFSHGLQFAARSVAAGGRLLVMDPMLTMPFSELDVLDFGRYAGNGMARHLCVWEDVLDREQLQLEERRPAVSFLLNGCIEANGRFAYAFASMLWARACQWVYRSDARTSRLAGLLTAADGRLKRAGQGLSSSLCLFRRI